MRAAASIGNAARQMMDGSVVPYAGEEALYPVFVNEVRLAEPVTQIQPLHRNLRLDLLLVCCSNPT